MNSLQPNSAFAVFRSIDQGRSKAIDFDRYVGVLRRQWTVVVASTLLSGLLGLASALTAVPLFTAQVELLIDTTNSKVVEQLSAFAGVVDDESSVLSQVEIIRSESIATHVVDKLGLANDPEFWASGDSALQSAKTLVRRALNVRGWLSGTLPPEPTAEDLRRDAIDTIRGEVLVSRVGRTFVLEVGYTAVTPDLAARIANSIGDAYLRDKLDSKYEATRRASDWLQERIGELREKALRSDMAVQKFKADNGLVSAGLTLVSDQKLTEMNTALVTAQSETAGARAKYDRVATIIESKDIDALVTDLLDSAVSNDLRTKYLTAAKLEADITRRLGPDHLQAQKLRDEMEEYRRLMFTELKRLAESYRSELDIALARENSIAENVKRAKSESSVAAEAQVQLRELEREAETYRNLYESFLGRYQEAIQQQSFPVTDARIISTATPPKAPSYPNKPLAIALFLVLGAGIGASIAAVREFRDRFIRSGEQIRDEFGLEFLGNVPLLRKRRIARAKVDGSTVPTGVLKKQDSVSDYVVDNPLSAFAEALRSAKIAADLATQNQNRSCRFIGVVSCLPGEGKSTVAVNFAELLAKQGARTILIDADLRNPGATRAIAPHAQMGLVQVLADSTSWQDVLLHNPATNLAFVPTIVRHRVPHSSELLQSANMQKLMRDLESRYDYVLLDLPPLGPIVDARAMAQFIDGFMLVVEWGRITRSYLRYIITQEKLVSAKCFGTVLNKVDVSKMKSYANADHYMGNYSKYYHESA